MGPALAFAAVVLRLVLRDRTALFFMLVLPVVVIVIIGSTFGGQGGLRVGVVAPAGATADAVVAALDAGGDVTVERFDDAAEMRSAVRTYALDGGVVVPEAIDADLAAGRPVDVELVVLPAGDGGFAVRSALQGALDEVGDPLVAARALVSETGIAAAEARSAVESLDRDAAVGIVTVDVGGSAEGLSQFALTAPQNLVLFTFINALTSATVIVVARRDGVLRRALAAPVSPTTVLTGLGLGWYALAMVQSAVIVAIGWLAFGVDWGDPLAATALVLVFAAVGCGAGLLVGALGENQDRVSSLTPPLGIVLGALGGCMVPLEVFPPPMLAVAHLVPHYWAITAWQSLVFDGAGLADVAGPLAVLVGYAVVLLSAAVVVLRRRLTA